MNRPSPARITVVGLGPGTASLRTVGTQRVLDEAQRIILRTRIHPGLDDLAGDARVTSCDDLYQNLPTFDSVYEAIADRVLEAAFDGDVVFAVPGHPRFGERSVALLQRKSEQRGVPIEVLDGVSAIDAAFGALEVDPLAEQVQILDATALEAIAADQPFSGGRLALDPGRPCLVVQVYAPAVAAGAKLALSRSFPDDHTVAILRATGVPEQESVSWCALYEIDRRDVDHLTSVWVPALSAVEGLRSAGGLQRIVARLRAPGGCPWDREQTNASLRGAVIEEAYEVVDAIDAEDVENLVEELGDLLLQVALHAQIAEERGDFVVEDVYEALGRKLVRRHPHVFADVVAGSPDQVIRNWQAIKAAERLDRGREATVQHLDRLPRSMPALLRATRLLGEVQNGRPDTPSAEEAIADRLFDSVRDAVAAGLDPERLLDDALRRRVAGLIPKAISETGGA